MKLLVLSFLASSVLAAQSSCGSKGYDKGIQAYDYIEGSSTVKSCGALCTAESKCKSFAVGAGACLLYSTTLYVAIASF